uniref:hypothetical protein n=1 Tax=Ningiella ruwaisensis TaxID=2364274 RepID=UPI0010A098F2|nr:hypothetical protein [Ningiella ruwaisensis]
MSDDSLEQKVKQLEKQLLRERMARKKAEDILRQKTLELFDANERISTATKRLQSALWASGESVWEWFAEDDIYRLYTSVTEKEVVVQRRGKLNELIASLSENSSKIFKEKWQAHLAGKTDSVDVVIHRKSHSKGIWRWLRICGRIVSRNADNSAKQFIGIFKDITAQYEQDQTFRIIKDTYIRTEQPGFIIKIDSQRIEGIIKIDSQRIEGTDSMFKLLGGARADFSQQDIRQLLPVSEILEHQKNRQRFFEHTVNTRDGRSINCEFILPKMLEDEGENGGYSYAVGFFRPKNHN